MSLREQVLNYRKSKYFSSSRSLTARRWKLWQLSNFPTSYLLPEVRDIAQLYTSSSERHFINRHTISHNETCPFNIGTAICTRAPNKFVIPTQSDRNHCQRESYFARIHIVVVTKAQDFAIPKKVAGIRCQRHGL